MKRNPSLKCRSRGRSRRPRWRHRDGVDTFAMSHVAPHRRRSARGIRVRTRRADWNSPLRSKPRVIRGDPSAATVGQLCAAPTFGRLTGDAHWLPIEKYIEYIASALDLWQGHFTIKLIAVNRLRRLADGREGERGSVLHSGCPVEHPILGNLLPKRFETFSKCFGFLFALTSQKVRLR